MAIGDNTDMWGRLKNLLPVGWFGDNNPIRDALLWGYANALAWGYTLYLYAKDQTRIKSATDGWLDLIGFDFFGNNLVRYANQTDSSYRNRILINIFRERTTRHAMEQVLYDLTGRWPIIIEPARPADVGSYGAAVAVSRASTATYFDLSGRLVTADPNTARYNTDAVTGLGRLLIEGAATNLLTYSNDLTNAAWTKNDSTITTNNQLAPDGTPMQLVTQGSAGTGYMRRAANATIVPGSQTSSKIFKTGNHDWIRFVLSDVTALTNGGSAWFDITNGVVGTVSNMGTSTTTVASVTNLGQGFFLCSVTTDLPGSTANIAVSGVTANNTTTRVSGGTRYEWGAQLEQGTSVTSRILTTSATASRAADILLNNMPAGSVAIGGYGVAGSYGSILLPYQAFITAFRPLGQGLPFVSGYGVSTGAYSTPSRSAYGQLSGGDVTDADIYAAIDATKPIGTVAWTRISS
jgi:hypothetical protein